MARQLLIETKLNSLSLQEGVKPKNPHCLGTIKGPCADYREKTRNGNFYSRRLWENVFKDPLVKESLEDNVLIGELDHPGDRLETKAVNACIVLTDYEFDDNEGVVIGTFDILDTPNGKILKSLLDYGCKMGVSSRGEGDVTEVDGQNNIDEDTYYFVAFDAVVLPAVKSAKPTLAESLQKRQSLKESLEEQIKSATTLSEVNTIKKVVEAVEMPELDSIIESINIKSKELEGTTGSSNLMEDLENLTRQYDELKQENVKLKESVNTFKDRLSKAVIACKKSNSLIEDYKTKQDKFVESTQHNEQQLSDYKERLAKANDRYLEMVANHKADVDKYTIQINKLNESLKNVRSELSSRDDVEYSLRESISVLEQKLQDVKDSNNTMNNSMQSQYREVCSVNESLKSKLTESKKSITNRDDKYFSLLKDYANLKSQMTGVDAKLIIESINKDSTAKSIDTIVESIVDRNDRYRSLSSLSDPLFTNSDNKKVSIKKGNSEDEQVRSFMEQVTKML